MLRIAECVAESKGVLKVYQIMTGWWRRFMEWNPGSRLEQEITLLAKELKKEKEKGRGESCQERSR